MARSAEGGIELGAGQEVTGFTIVTDQNPGPPVLMPITLAGRDVTLRPTQPEDAAFLYADSHSEPDRVWKYMSYGPWPDPDTFASWVAERSESRDPLWFTVVDNQSRRPIGMATMLNYDPDNRRVELGHIWYVISAQGTSANTEATYLLLRHAFLDYRARRVEWKCDSLNERSRAAALRLGFSFEGIFAQHMIVKGRNRDTAWFALTDIDWPNAAARLEERLYQNERDQNRREELTEIGLTEIGVSDQPVDE